MSLPQLSHPKYRPDIDGLRAIAVLAVVAFHAFPTKLKGGFIGVDVFFVISGFLISLIIFDGLDKSTFSFSTFYARRIKRIFPALILVLVSCFIFGWYALLADEYKQLGKHIAGGASFISNFVLWGESGYFDNTAETKPLLHLWSLGVEEQFYIVWPILLWFAYKKRFNLLSIGVLVAIISFYQNIHQVKLDAVADFYSPQTRFWELMVGSILAWLRLYKPDFSAVTPCKADQWLYRIVFRDPRESDGKALASTISIIAVALLAYGFLRINKEIGFPGPWAIIPVLSAALIIFAGPKAWVNRVILSNKIAVWFGLISFPLYLWHWPLLSFSRIVEGETPAITIRISAVLLAILLAWLTTKLVERPIRLGGYGAVKVTVLFFLMLVTAIVGYNTYRRDGLKFRAIATPGSYNAIAFDWPDYKIKTNKCETATRPLESRFCVMSEDFPVTVALVGDSHANSLYDFVKDYYAMKRTGVIQLGKEGCPPFLGVERDKNNCPKLMNDIVSYIASNNDIKKVLITGRFAAALTGVNFGGETKKNFYSLALVDDPAITDRGEIFKIGLRKIVKRLLDVNKDVYILLDSPELNFDPKSCLRKLSTSSCSIEKRIVMDRQSGYRQIIGQIASEYRIHVVDLLDGFCSETHCFAKGGDKILYRDTHHLGIWASEYLMSKEIHLD